MSRIGTTIKLFVAGMHKRSARSELEDAEDGMKRCERLLVAMAASGGGLPMPDGNLWHEHVASEVPELLAEYSRAYLRSVAARVMVGQPEDCVDDLDHYETGPVPAQ